MWKVLIVDDDFVNRKLLAEILKDKADCDVAADGQEAIEAYELSLSNTSQYDVVLLDIAMPGTDGLDVLNYIREKEESMGVLLGCGLPIIMVTAYKEPFLDAFNKGCDDYVLKPINADHLIHKIREKIAGE